ncbi:MAG: hypothetical protein ACD_60C00009G0011 [uncultured bacterium]|nr:MAG: hypothetical protein ACD_60C00009G0011 [uncultured bacterium]
MNVEAWLNQLIRWNTRFITPIVYKTKFSGEAIVFLGGGTWQLTGILAAKKLGLDIVLIDSSATSIGVKFADHVLIRNDFDIPSILQYLAQLSLKIIGVVAIVSDIGQLPAAKLRNALGLPGIQPDIIQAFIEKSKQRESWDSAFLPNPKWRSFNNLNEATDYLHHTNHFPLIIKPVDSAGSRGISVLQNRSDIDTALKKAFQTSHAKKVIIEEYIHGTEFAIETFSHKKNVFVLAISQKNKVPGTDNTVASELYTPTYSDSVLKQMTTLVTNALTALNYSDGPAHTEILLTPKNECFLVETGARGGGFMVADGIVPLASGFDLATATVLSAIGIDFEFQPPNIVRPYLLRFIPSQPGTIKSYSGFDAFNDHPNVLTSPIVEIGTHCSNPICDAHRVCYLLSYGNTYEEAKLHADNGEKIIKFQYE